MNQITSKKYGVLHTKFKVDRITLIIYKPPFTSRALPAKGSKEESPGFLNSTDLVDF